MPISFRTKAPRFREASCQTWETYNYLVTLPFSDPTLRREQIAVILVTPIYCVLPGSSLGVWRRENIFITASSLGWT